MNVRKPVDYGTMYRELTAILAQNLSQMDKVYAIGKAISQRPEKGAAVAAAEFLQTNFPDRAGFSPRNVRRMRDFYRTYKNDQRLLWQKIKQLGVLYILQKYALYRFPPDVVCKHPQKLRSCRSCHQRAAGKTAQKRSVFVPRGAGKPVNVSDNLKRIGVVLVCYFRI
mgnify:CR=1 FL=1